MTAHPHFHEGEEVEVWQSISQLPHAGEYAHWRKAKIVIRTVVARHLDQYEVQFPDGTRAVFDAANIRAVLP